MGLFNKKKPELETPVTQTEQDTSVGTAADVEAVMKKYDRESNTRVWEGAPSLVIRALMALFAAYTIVDTVFLSILPQRRLPIFMGVLLFIGFLTFPARKGESRVNHMPWYDIIMLLWAAVHISSMRSMLRRLSDVCPRHAERSVYDHRSDRHSGSGGTVPPVCGHAYSVRGRRTAGVHLLESDGGSAEPLKICA